MLSQQAARLRAGMSEEELEETLERPEEEVEQVVAQNLTPTVTPQMSAELEARVFREIGDGGFDSHDFEIMQRLGRISVQDATGSGEPRTAVIAYAARYIVRIAYSRPLTTLIKEYLPVAKAIAMNELLLLQHLCGIPEDKYRAASTPPSCDPPVIPLLGYFFSAPSDDAVMESLDAEQDSVWLVYAWEGLKPLAMYLQAGPPRPQPGFFKAPEVAEQEAWDGRKAMLRGLSRQLLAAIDFIHSADVVHGSLSSGSVYMSASEDCNPEGLIVKLDGFGFGKWYAGSGSSGSSSSSSISGIAAPGPASCLTALEEGKRTDLQAAALVLAETFTAGMAGTAAGCMTWASLKRLLFDVFHEDMAAFKAYCLEDASGSFQRFVDFMDEDEGAGWEFLGQLLTGRATALQLSQHKFLLAAITSSSPKRFL